MLSPAARISGAYALAAGLWILCSDWALSFIPGGGGQFVQSSKGIAFVTFTAAVLYGGLRREFERRAAVTTALRAAHDRLERSNGELQSLVDHLPDVFLRTTLDGRVEMASVHCQQEFGYSAAELTGQSLAILSAEPGGYERFMAVLHRGGGRVNHHELPVRRKDGSVVWVSINAYLRYGPDGQAVGIDAVARNVTRRRALEERLRHLAGHDALTGLCNRMRLEDRLGHAIRRSRRDGRALALLYMDLDGFKAVNDTYGHHSGDHLLVTVAERLRTALRESDTIARMGGDEFAVVLEGGATTDGAVTVAEKLAALVAAPYPGITLGVTASIGIALFPGDGDSTEALLRAADAAMYQAKHDGKNRYTLAASRTGPAAVTAP